jgi:hypothetical protein
LKNMITGSQFDRTDRHHPAVFYRTQDHQSRSVGQRRHGFGRQ